jgi:hypothetical protein
MSMVRASHIDCTGAVRLWCQISAGHLAYFEAADEFLGLAAEFLRRQDA